MINTRTYITALALALLGGLTACNPTSADYHAVAPENLIPEAKMTQILLDVHIIEGARSGTRVLGDTADVNVYYKGLYEKYQITPGQYDTSFLYYSHYPEKMMHMYDVVIDSLNLTELRVDEAVRTGDAE